MSKSILVAILLGIVDAKVRPLHPSVGATSNPLTKAHERRVRDQLVKSPRVCSSGMLVEADHHEDSHPVVGAGSCKAQCLFQDDQNEWCFSTTAPMLKTGWNWTQNTGTNFWQIRFMPYFETQIFIDSKLKI